MKTTRIEATYRIVTPMFCAGADQGQPEFRLPSFKGVLRFWWRALAWGWYGGDLKEIQKAEEALFGGLRAGQSKLLLTSLKAHDAEPLEKDKVLEIDGKLIGEGARYFGYGLLEAFGSRKRGTRAGQLLRGCFLPGAEISVRGLVRDVNEEQLKQIVDTFKAVGLFGGIGARTRRGYGSLTLLKVHVDGRAIYRAATTLEELRTEVQSLLKASRLEKEPRYAAFWARSRVVIYSPLGQCQVSGVDVLNSIGEEMLRYRSLGRGGKILSGRGSIQRRFVNDARIVLGGEDIDPGYPERLAFGLPHNYGKDEVLHVVPADPRLSRRASPLLIHVHELSEVAVGVLAFLRSTFLPGDQPRVLVRKEAVPIKQDDTFWKPIDDFLDGLILASKSSRGEQVWPAR